MHTTRVTVSAGVSIRVSVIVTIRISVSSGRLNIEDNYSMSWRHVVFLSIGVFRVDF